MLLVGPAAGALGPTRFAAADNWDGSAGALWSTNANWADGSEPTSTDAAIFPTPIPASGANISMLPTGPGEQAASVTFNDSYTLVSTGILTLFGAGGNVAVAGGKTATINVPLHGSVGLTKTGTGTLRFNNSGASNGFTGPVTIGGTLSILRDSHLGNAANTVLLSQGATQGTLQIGSSFSTSRVISVGAFGGNISVDSARTFTLNAGFGTTTGSPLNVNGLGTLWLNASSARSGQTNITNGTVHLGNGLGLGTGGINISNNGRLTLGAGVSTSRFTTLNNNSTLRSNGAGASHVGQVDVGNLDLNPSVTLNSGDASAHSLTIGNYTDGSGSTTHVTGAGSVILNGSNSYAGAWAVDSGTLRLTHADAIASSASPVVINSAGAVRAETASNYAGGWTVNGLLSVENATGLGVGASAVDVNSGGTLHIGGVNLARDVALHNGGTVRGNSATASGTITAAALSSVTLESSAEQTDQMFVNSYAGGIGTTTHVGGPGEVVLSGANTYAGNWEIETGAGLRVDHASALGTGSSPVLVGPGGTLHLRGPTITRGITMDNSATLLGSTNGSTVGRPNGTVFVTPGADVLFSTITGSGSMTVGDSANDLTGGGGGSTITVSDDSSVILGSSSNYVGNWVVQGQLQANNDNRLGDLGNNVIIDSGTFVSFSPFTTSRQFIVSGDPQIQAFFGGPMTFNSGLTGTFNLLEFLNDQPIVLNAAATSFTGTAVNIKGTLKVNHNQAAGAVPFNVLGGFTPGVLELGSGVTLSQNATMFNQTFLRGNNNATYAGTITLDNGADMTFATVSSGDVFTIGDGANDLTGGGAGSVITAAGPGKIVLAQPNNVTAEWNITGGIVEVAAHNRLGNAGFVTVSGTGALELNNATVTSTQLFLNDGGALRGTGISTFSNSGYPKVTNADADVFITVPTAADRLTFGAAIRSATATPSLATIHVNGPGRVVLASGGASAADIFGGSWEQSDGILQVGQSNGLPINAIGFKNGDPAQANAIRVNGGVLAVGAVGASPDPAWLRADVTLNGGAIASTNGITAQYGGDFIVEAGSTSRVLLYDPVNPATVRDVKLVAGAPDGDPLGALTHWRASSTLIVDPGTTGGGGIFYIERTGGIVDVAAASPTLQIDPGAAVVLGGSMDALADGFKHVNVVNHATGSFVVTEGDKNIGSLSGMGDTDIAIGTSLTVHQNVNTAHGSITGSGSLVKEGSGTLTVNNLTVGSITVNGGAVSSASPANVTAGHSITVAGGSLSRPSIINNGTLSVAAGALTTDLLAVGNDGTLTGGSGTGSADISGGTVSAKKVVLGSSSGGTGNLTVRGTGSLESNKLAANDLIVEPGGTVTITEPAVLEDPIMDGSVVAGYVHDGLVVVNGGTLTAPKMKLGVTVGTIGQFNLDAGVVRLDTLGVGNDGTGLGGSGSGFVALAGGTLDVNTVVLGSIVGGVGNIAGPATLAASDSYQLVNGQINVPLAGTAGLTKFGSTPVLINEIDTHTGTTDVQGGVLISTFGFKGGGPMAISENSVAVVPASSPSTFNPVNDVFPSGSNATASRVSFLVIVGNGQLDLNNNDMVIDHTGVSPLADIRDLLASGYNFAAHDGPGIISTTALNTDPFTFALGYGENADLPLPYGTDLAGGPFADQDPDATSVLIKFTWIGDVTLDGVLDFQDLSIFNGNYDSGATSGRVWTDGDLNYDGFIDFQDLSLFNANYDPSKPSMPEPGVGGVVALLGATLVRRRHQRTRAHAWRLTRGTCPRARCRPSLLA